MLHLQRSKQLQFMALKSLTEVQSRLLQVFASTELGIGQPWSLKNLWKAGMGGCGQYDNNTTKKGENCTELSDSLAYYRRFPFTT